MHSKGRFMSTFLSKIRLAWPTKKVLYSVFGTFIFANVVHFLILLATEYFLSSVTRGFYFDWYSVLLGFSIGLSLNSLVAAVLIFILLIGLNKESRQWNHAAVYLSLGLPIAPLLDLLFHYTRLVPYIGYKNLFGTDASIFVRLRDALVPGFANPIIQIPIGYRILFILLAALNGIFIYKHTESSLRSAAAFMTSYLSVCAIIAFLSPSNIQPALVFENIILLPALAWIANAFLIGRSEFAAKAFSSPGE